MRVKVVKKRKRKRQKYTYCKCNQELTHWKRLWCWEGLGAGGEGEDRGWDGWMASLTRWTWVSVNSGSWWWTGRPGVLRFMGSQRVGHDWATDLIWSIIEEKGSGHIFSPRISKSRFYCVLTSAHKLIVCWALFYTKLKKKSDIWYVL